MEVRSRPKSLQKACFFRPQIFLGRKNPQILDLVSKTASISDHVAKFCGDRPRDRGDLALIALSQRAALIMIIIIIIIINPETLPSKQPFWDRPGVLADRAVVQATLSSSFQ